jgi:hypothetical protein
MAIIFPEMTVGKILEINPMTAQILFRYGLRSFFAPSVANATLEQLSHVYGFNLTTVIQDLNDCLYVRSDTLQLV